MAQKNEDRDWSEIIAEVRSKAKSEVDEAIEEIRPKVKALVEKVRQANFQEEAEEFLAKLRKMADDLSSSSEAPSKPKATKGRKILYIDENHDEWRRAKKEWSDAQKEKYRQAAIEKYGE